MFSYIYTIKLNDYRMREFKEITVEELIAHDNYKIGNHTFSLKPSGRKYYFENLVGGGNSYAYTQFGLSKTDLRDFLGYRTDGEFPEVVIEDIAKLYNWFYDKWKDINGEKKPTKTDITLEDGGIITFPLKIESQEHWNTTWKKLNKSGFKWADGDELDDFFSECHEFPAEIDYVKDQKITINE
jgi:hypothetical protein